ncbi:MAG: hypothetical protein IIA07_12395 [Proteobacteria bacterium]|nr:hypothetical protein [Pseudomonadota bacterium]
MREALLILNGKKAGRPEIRQAVNTLRDAEHRLDVRVTWEAGDIHRYIDEACRRNIERVVVGGGDGSVNEAANSILTREGNALALGIMPLGTANDFATSCRIPSDPLESLRLALTGESRSIDAVQANEQFFLNVASVGFGAAVTANLGSSKRYQSGIAAGLPVHSVIRALDLIPL